LSPEEVDDREDAVEVGDLSALAGSARNDGTEGGVDWRQSNVTALAAFTDEFDLEDEFDLAESGLRIRRLL